MEVKTVDKEKMVSKIQSNSIFVLTALYLGNSGIEGNRIFGFFFKEEDAKNAVLGNACDIFEYTFNYVVVEETDSGIHGRVIRELWFKWNDKKKKYQSCKKPSSLNGIVNFGIG